MREYSRDVFRALIFSKDPDKIDEGMELLWSKGPQGLTEILEEVGADLDPSTEDSLSNSLYDLTNGEIHDYLYFCLFQVLAVHKVRWLSEMEQFCIECCNLPRIPFDMRVLTNMKELILNENRLTELPKEVFSLKKVTEINLVYNPIAEIPNEIGNLKKLESFELGKSRLSSLPEGMGELTNLKILTIFETSLSILPDWIGRLTRLTQLDIQGSL